MNNINNILFLDFIKDNSGYYILFFIAVIISYPIHLILLPRYYSSLFDVLKTPEYLKKSKIILIKILLLWIISHSIICGILYIKSYLIPKYYMYFRTFIFENILKKYKKKFELLIPSEIITKAMEIPWSAKNIMVIFINKILPQLLVSIIIIIYFFYISFRIGIITLISLIIILITLYYLSKDCADKSSDTYKYFKRVNNLLSDKLNNMFNIYTSSHIDYEIKDNRKEEEICKEKDVISMKCNANTNLILLILSIISFTFGLYQIFQEYSSNKYGTKIFISNILILKNYLYTLEQISLEIPSLSYNIGVLHNEYKYLEEISDNKDISENNKNVNIKDGKIEVKNIVFGYNENKKIYNNFSITIEPHKKTAIIGKSGSGKSTIIKLLIGFYKVNKGEILIDNININDYKLDKLRKNIAYVNQNTTLFNNSIIYNIKYGTNVSDKEVNNLISSMNIWDFFKFLNYDLSKNVGVNGNKLSGGQKQIILVLRALLNNESKIIILDEPTSALDNQNKDILINILSKIKDKTIIIVTHDNNIMNFVDNTIYLNNK